MEIRSILVNVGFDPLATSALRYGVDLAKTFGADLLGVAADDPVLSYPAMETGAVAIDAYAMQREEIEHALQSAEEQFVAAVPSDIRARFVGAMMQPTPCLTNTAAQADLIVTTARTTSAFRLPQTVNIGELIVSSGRPLIAVADDANVARLDKLLIAWKDTREARRAVADALPLLGRASEIVAVTIGEGDLAAERRGLDQLAAWLEAHHLHARTELIDNPDRFTDVLESTGLAEGADLVVAGGYGHSRMREWLFGGMTRNLLGANSLTRFLSN